MIVSIKKERPKPFFYFDTVSGRPIRFSVRKSYIKGRRVGIDKFPPQRKKNGRSRSFCM